MNMIKQLAHDCNYDFKAMVSRLDKSDDLVGVGADLAPSTLIGAYMNGVFPWYDDEPICWYSPSTRCVITPSDFRPKKSLVRTAKKSSWVLTTNHAFDDVIHACANARPHATWINADMTHAYQNLHRLGVAVSIEVWADKPDGTLIGGLYGLQLGAMFCGESMFHAQTDASKIAFWGLMMLCQKMGVELVDCQLENSHLMSLGARLMDRDEFLTHLPKTQQHAPTLNTLPIKVADFILHKIPLP